MANPIDGMPPETYWETNDRLFVDRSVFDECIDEIEASLSLPDLLNIANMKKENGWVSGDCDWQGVTTFSGLLDLAVKQGEYGCFFVYMCIRESGDQHGDALEKIVEHAKIRNPPPPWKDVGSVPASPGDQQLSDSPGDIDFMRFSGARARRDTDETMLDSRRVPEMEEDLKPGISQGSLDEEEEEGKDIGSKSVKADGKGEERAAFVSGLGGTLKNAPVSANPAATTTAVPVKDPNGSKKSDPIFIGKVPRLPSENKPEESPEADSLEAVPSENSEFRQDVTNDEGDMVATNEAPHVPKDSVMNIVLKLQENQNRIQEEQDRNSKDIQQMKDQRLQDARETQDLRIKVEQLESQLRSTIEDRDRLQAEVIALSEEGETKDRELKAELKKANDKIAKLQQDLKTSRTMAKTQREVAEKRHREQTEKAQKEHQAQTKKLSREKDEVLQDLKDKEQEQQKMKDKLQDRAKRQLRAMEEEKDEEIQAEKAKSEKLEEKVRQLRQNPPSDRQSKTGAGREESDGGTVHDTVMRTKPSVRFDDIAGLLGAKEALKEALVYPRKYPELCPGNPWPAILLYGPEGTGKTMLAKAVATEGDCTFHHVTPANINKKFVGESEEKIKEIFEAARSEKTRSNKNAVIFIDEIDSHCNARSSGDHQVARSIKGELLQQMQGVGASSDGILVLACTNIPWELDPAFLRRFVRHIYIGLPDTDTRREMFEKLLKQKKVRNTLTPADLMKLADNTPGFSGDDIGKVIVRATAMYRGRVIKATHFKKVSGPSLSDPQVDEHDFKKECDSNDEGAIEMEYSEEPGDKYVKLLNVVPLEDFNKAVETTCASVAAERIDRYKKFNPKV